MALRVLFIGGTGIISAACARETVAAGIALTVLNRGRTATRPLPDGVRQVLGDVDACADGAALRDLLDGAGRDGAGRHDAGRGGAGGSGGSAEFDAVVDFVAFTPDQVARDVEAFTGRVGQYVFVSSASAYQTPPLRWPITESTPLRNPSWGYSRDKIACEQLLTEAYRDSGFPAVLLRPSHTYDATMIPLTGGWTEVERMRRGAPVVVHGDGTSLWTLTHARDVASALVGMLGRPSLAGQAVHVTSDEVMTWDQIARELAAAAGAPDPQIVQVTSDEIAAAEPDWADGILGDMAHSLVFDNSLVKRIGPGLVRADELGGRRAGDRAVARRRPGPARDRHWGGRGTGPSRRARRLTPLDGPRRGVRGAQPTERVTRVRQFTPFRRVRRRAPVPRPPVREIPGGRCWSTTADEVSKHRCASWSRIRAIWRHGICG